MAELQALRLQDLDRGRGALHIRRHDLVFTVMLDELITEMTNDWWRWRLVRAGRGRLAV